VFPRLKPHLLVPLLLVLLLLVLLLLVLLLLVLLLLVLLLLVLLLKMSVSLESKLINFDDDLNRHLDILFLTLKHTLAHHS